MNSNKDIEILIEKYFNGETSLEEEKQLQVFFQGEDISAELKSYQDQFLMSEALKKVSSNNFSDDDLFAKLDAQEEQSRVVVMEPKRSTVLTWTYRVAAAVALIMVGFWVGGRFSTNEEVKLMQQELATLKSQLQSSSASGRLQAVSNVSGVKKSNKEMILTLEAVMKNDPNMHVRTKAVEALVKTGSKQEVLELLSGALLEESEPAVQIAIIDALIGLDESSAIQSLEKLTEEEGVLKEVKDEAYLGIFKLKEM